MLKKNFKMLKTIFKKKEKGKKLLKNLNFIIF